MGDVDVVGGVGCPASRGAPARQRRARRGTSCDKKNCTRHHKDTHDQEEAKGTKGGGGDSIDTPESEEHDRDYDELRRENLRASGHHSMNFQRENEEARAIFKGQGSIWRLMPLISRI